MNNTYAVTEFAENIICIVPHKKKGKTFSDYNSATKYAHKLEKQGYSFRDYWINHTGTNQRPEWLTREV